MGRVVSLIETIVEECGPPGGAKVCNDGYHKLGNQAATMLHSTHTTY